VQIHLHEGSVEAISTQLPPPRFHPREIPALADGAFIEDYPLTVAGRTVRIACVNTGTTHTVIFGATLPDDALFLEVSPRIETHPMFPERTSVLWAVVASRGEIRVRIWERGVGETLGLWQRRGGSGGTGAPCRLGRRGGRRRLQRGRASGAPATRRRGVDGAGKLCVSGGGLCMMRKIDNPLLQVRGGQRG
jgi:hypothetical protein